MNRRSFLGALLSLCCACPNESGQPAEPSSDEIEQWDREFEEAARMPIEVRLSTPYFGRSPAQMRRLRLEC
jgi:hypothetical protein